MLTHDSNPVRAFVVAGIVSGDLQPNQRLPTEREFAAMFGKPRSLVREALTVLEAEGRIVRQVGRGTYVRAADAGLPMQPFDTDISPATLLEARLAFEPGLATLIAANATGADFRKMESCIERADAADTVEDYEAQDDAFHFSLALATHNPVLIGTARQLSAARYSAAWGALKKAAGILESERRIFVRNEHMRILETVTNRDAAAASRALREHVVSVRDRLLR